MAQQFWVRQDDQVTGPFSPGQLVQMAREGRLDKTDMVSPDNSRWTPASNVKGLFDAPSPSGGAAPPPMPGEQAPKAAKKSVPPALVAAVIAVVLLGAGALIAWQAWPPSGDDESDQANEDYAERKYQQSQRPRQDDQSDSDDQDSRPDRANRGGGQGDDGQTPPAEPQTDQGSMAPPTLEAIGQWLADHRDWHRRVCPETQSMIG